MGSTLDRNQQKNQYPFFNNGIRESHEEGRHPLSSSLSLRFDRRNWTKIPANISSGHLIDLWAPFGSGERKGTDGRRKAIHSKVNGPLSPSLSPPLGTRFSFLPPLSAGCSSGQFKRDGAKMYSEDRKLVYSANTLQIASCTLLDS